tara:strand:- start:341 stop:1393 length:1053 start_codon:yes stop_codon:yes gene_type:complete
MILRFYGLYIKNSQFKGGHRVADKCIVLGSTSFAGAWFVNEALSRGLDVIGISRSPEPSDIFLPYKSHQNLEKFTYYQLDINDDNDKIIALIMDEKPDYIVDFAGQGMVAPSWEWPEQWYNTNVVSKVKIHNALKNVDFLKRYVRISTPEVYGSTDGLISEHTNYKPSTPYAVSHAAIDMSLRAYYQQYNFPVIFTRFANFYGSHQQLYRITPRAIYCALTGETLPLHGGGKSIRAFIHGKDVSDGIFRAIENGQLGEIYHFSTDEFITIHDLVEKIAQYAHVSMDSFVKITEDRPAKDPAYFMSSERAKSELGWVVQYDLDLGLKDTYEWVSENLEEIKKLPKDYIHKK